MSSPIDLFITLSKDAAYIAADLAPVPGVSIALDLLFGIVDLCQNVTTNKHAAQQLCDRCEKLLYALRDSVSSVPSNRLEESRTAVIKCLSDIKDKMAVWSSKSRLVQFTRQDAINGDIEGGIKAIADCMVDFNLASQISIHEWQTQFAKNAQLDHDKVTEHLSKLLTLQDITQGTLAEHGNILREIMATMQSRVKEVRTADVALESLSYNLYQLQLQSGDPFLPCPNLNSGELKIIARCHKRGSAGTDIYQGLYLGQKKVAIKVIRSAASSKRGLKVFMAEVKIWEQIWKVDRGAHIIPFLGFYQDDSGPPCMISAWQENGNAIDFVKTRGDDLDYKQLIRGIALGVRVLHTLAPCPVVHGELRGSNILIDGHENPLIADFGLSKLVENITDVPFSQSMGITDSYRWFAPEVCKGGRLSLRSDIFSMAMTFLELLTHRPPFREIRRTTGVIIAASDGKLPRRPMEEEIVDRGLDDSLWCLFTRCWSSDPSARPTVEEVLRDLEE